MLQWLQNLPKALFVAIVLGVGILFIVFSDPPRTICDTQMKHLREITKSFLQVDPKRKTQTKSNFTRLYEICQKSNTSGGCYELFNNLKRGLKDIQTVSPECYSSITQYQAFTHMLWSSIDLMVRIAWGSSPPTSSAQKANWLDASDLNLFCTLRKTALDIYSTSRWDQFTNEYFSKLPGVDSLSREEAWSRMLFSINCAQYL